MSARGRSGDRKEDKKPEEKSKSFGARTHDIGPSGKPKLHFIQAKGPADARERARAASSGSSNSGGHIPYKDPAHKPGQQTHYHPTDAKGEKKEGGLHFLTGDKKNPNLK
ncbi:unnamed protein product [Didymodactylos carnosus]|uniref:Uncharacterized protein n=1 Tax=Didymodactylos carnosus TaxID=1234261 RepID=A0A814S792_9BILA|nr:unnamed protein product [Didymodactylos carnosus]CAF1143589.1 unnamed protein product [Didymodactylos carnosus]CAF3708465.1 unnamed protein product [Didymodactylos carnosus]CAF3907203.1 unnamed protein product [Didymodactylos carnosus]